MKEVIGTVNGGIVLVKRGNYSTFVCFEQQTTQPVYVLVKHGNYLLNRMPFYIFLNSGCHYITNRRSLPRKILHTIQLLVYG